MPAQTLSGWTASAIGPRVAQSSPAVIGQLLADPKLAAMGEESNVYNTAPPEIQRQIDAAREAALSGTPMSSTVDRNQPNKPAKAGQSAVARNTNLTPGSEPVGQLQQDAGNRDAAGNLTTASGQPLQAGTSSVGWLNWLSQHPVTADQLLTPQTGVVDPKLATRQYSSPMQGVRQTDVVVSAFNNSGNIPGDVQNAINSLNMNQSLRRAQQAELVDTLFKNANVSPVYAEAFRAAVVQPGASVGFGSRILSNAEMGANVTGASAAARNIDARTKAINTPDNRQNQLNALRQQRAAAGQNPMGFYTGSTQEKLDKQIMNLENDIRTNQLPGRIATAAAGTQSGWVPIR